MRMYMCACVLTWARGELLRMMHVHVHVRVHMCMRVCMCAYLGERRALADDGDERRDA